MRAIIAVVALGSATACTADEVQAPGPASPALHSVGDIAGLERVIATPEGALIGAGRAEAGSISVVRFFTDGALDNTYGVGGRVQLDGELVSALLEVGDGAVLVATRNEGGGGAVARITADGFLDPAFGEGGVLSLDRAPGGIALRPAGGYLIGLDSTDGRDMVLATDVAGSGTSRVDDALFGPDDVPFVARAVAATGDKIAVAGSLGEALAVYWYGADSDWSVQPADPHLDPRGLANIGDGFVIGGVFRAGTGFGAIHFAATGGYDDTYGIDGVARTGVGSVTAATLADPWGAVLLVGATDGTPHPRIIRLLGNGTLDPAFGSDGVFTDLASEATIADAALVSDGSLVAVGVTSGGNGFVAHYVW